MGVIAIPQSLRDKLGDEAANAFVEIIKEIDLDARKDALALAEERFERRLTEECGKLRLEIEKLRTEMKVEMEKLRTEIERSKADIIKWTFIFWIGQIGAFSAILFAMLKLYFK